MNGSNERLSGVNVGGGGGRGSCAHAWGLAAYSWLEYCPHCGAHRIKESGVVIPPAYATDAVDCAYEDPSLPELITPRAADAVSFDFDRYNSLAALPQIRKGDRT